MWENTQIREIDSEQETAIVSVLAAAYVGDDAEPDPLAAGRVLIEMPLDEAFWAVGACDVRACRGCALVGDQCACCSHGVAPHDTCPVCDVEQDDESERHYERAHSAGAW